MSPFFNLRSLAFIAGARLSLPGKKNRFCTIFGGPVAGKKILFNKHIGLNIFSGRSELKTMKTLQKLIHHHVVLQEDAVIINAGAGFGLYELFFSRHLNNNGHIYSFESGTVALELLEKNLAYNHIENATVVKKAVSEKIGLISFFENPLSGSSLVETMARSRSKETATKNVFTTTLDIFCKRYELSPAFIRLNVNGSVNQALQGAQETIERCQPLLLAEPRRAEERAAIAQLLDTQQYDAFSISEYEWVRTQEDEQVQDILNGPLLLCPYRLKEEVNYALYNRYRRDAGAIQKWLPGRNTTEDYALN